MAPIASARAATRRRLEGRVGAKVRLSVWGFALFINLNPQLAGVKFATETEMSKTVRSRSSLLV